MRAKLRCTVRALSAIVILLEKPYLDKGPLFPFSSCFAQSDYTVLIRKWWLLNLLFSSASPLRSTCQSLIFAVFCIETRGISGISIRTGQLFLCGYNAAGSSANSPTTPPPVSHYHTAMKDPGVSVALLLLTVCTKPLTDYLSFACSVCETDQSSA